LQVDQVKVNLDIEAIESRFGYVFRNKEPLAAALTHASAAETVSGRKAKITRSDTNQRLEFLGDRVLGLVISEELYRRFPHLDEGGMTQRFHNIVSLAACARSARRMELGKHIVMSPAQATAGGGAASGILGDGAEAVIAAIYLDGGLEAASQFVLHFWAEEIEHAGVRPKDPKGALQEWAAAQGRQAPEYRVVNRSGPDHAPNFEVEVVVGDLPPARAQGKSKQEAERLAAQAALEHVGGRAGV
jgi:ribonuclease III